MGRETRVEWDDLFIPAAIDPDRWEDALAEMAWRTGASHGQLIGIGADRDVPFNIVTDSAGWPFDELKAIGGYGGDINYRVAANERHVRDGRYDPILYEDHYDATLPHLRSNDYVDFCAAIDIPYGCQTNLVVDGVGLIGLATLRKRRDGRTNRLERKTFGEAAASARRAVRLQERLEGEQARLIAGTFEAMALTAFVLDRRGRVQAQTQGAEQRVRQGDIQLRDGMLDAPAIPWSLARATAALAGEEGVSHIQLRVDLPAHRPALFLEGFRLPVRNWSFGKLPHAILLAREPSRDRAGVRGFLSALYGVTAAEADIAIRLFEGKSRETIAGERDVSVETLRGQMKTLYAKTGASGEAELMRLLAAIMA